MENFQQKLALGEQSAFQNKTSSQDFYSPPISNQGGQMDYFQTKNPNLGKFWSVWQ
jgi:hypothetical protein